MSDDNASDSVTLTEYRCRKCSGSFTAEEKDAHREFHRREKMKAAKKASKPGPMSKKRDAPYPPPPNSDMLGSLFEPWAENLAPAVVESKRGRREEPSELADGGGAKASKRKSKKTYNGGVIGRWTNGNGA